jgi:hypothetical protein
MFKKYLEIIPGQDSKDSVQNNGHFAPLGRDVTLQGAGGWGTRWLCCEWGVESIRRDVSAL